MTNRTLLSLLVLTAVAVSVGCKSEQAEQAAPAAEESLSDSTALQGETAPDAEMETEGTEGTEASAQ